MLFDLLKRYVGETAAPFAAIALFVVVVGVSLWLTPKLAGWIDAHKSGNKSFYDGMMEQPDEQTEE
ncbi:MAG: hypothetical protein IKM11_00710 [Oscillospiraceae bacterium]|nr:hypothetical protein [Oscillospiraceae bacterium]